MNGKESDFAEGSFFKFVTKFFYALHIPRAGIHIYLLLTSPVRSLIESDINVWMEQEHHDLFIQKIPSWKSLVWLLWKDEAYRNLFYYRIKKEYRVSSRILLEISKIFYKPLSTLFIKAKFIGEGFFIQHGYSTGISARKIGNNCWVNQMATIGFIDDGNAPTLGDNVHISVGARVLGDVSIGDNCIVGANAVVIKNVPANCTVVGIPARIVKRDGKRVDEPL